MRQLKQAPGADFARVMIAVAVAGEGGIIAAKDLAERTWGFSSRPALICKAAIGAGTIGGDDWASAFGGEYRAAAAEYLDAVLQGSIIGQLVGLRRVPLRRRLITAVSGATADWTGEAKPKRLTNATFARDALSALKVTAISVVTQEVLNSASGDPASEDLIRRDMIRAAREVLDTSFIDPTNAGQTDVTPAAITNGISAIPSTGIVRDDLVALVEAFDGDLTSAFVVLSPELAVEMNSADHPNIGARGGEVVGLPVITSRNVPTGVIALVDSDGIAYGDGPVQVDVSRQGALEMVDNPTDPATAGTVLVSLWQANLVGLLVEIAANWKRARPGSVAVLSGATYVGNSPS